MKLFVTLTVPDGKLLSLLSHRYGLVRMKNIKRVDVKFFVNLDKTLNVFIIFFRSSLPLCFIGKISFLKLFNI